MKCFNVTDNDTSRTLASDTKFQEILNNMKFQLKFQ